jgi:hypothetical protein
MRVLDVGVLTALVAAAQQRVKRPAGSHVVHTVARAEINAQLAQTLADRRDITGAAIGQPVDTRLDLCAPLRILQSLEPPIKCVGALHFEH